MHYGKNIEEKYKEILEDKRTDTEKLHDFFKLIYQPEYAIPFDITGSFSSDAIVDPAPAVVPYSVILTYRVPMTAPKAVINYVGFDVDNDRTYGVSYLFTLRVNQSPLENFALRTLSIYNLQPVCYVLQGGDVIDLVTQITTSFGTAALGYVNAKCYGRVSGWYFQDLETV